MREIAAAELERMVLMPKEELYNWMEMVGRQRYGVLGSVLIIVSFLVIDWLAMKYHNTISNACFYFYFYFWFYFVCEAKTAAGNVPYAHHVKCCALLLLPGYQSLRG